MQNTSLVPVPIPGTDRPIMATELEGRPFVPLKSMCQALGLDDDAQRRKLDQAEWATTVMITAVADDGKLRQMVALDANRAEVAS